MSTADEQARAGQAVYTKSVLAIYDFWVHGISNHLIWWMGSSSSCGWEISDHRRASSSSRATRLTTRRTQKFSRNTRGLDR